MVITETLCQRCDRVLRSAKSIADRYGRRCLAIIRAAAKVVDLADYKAAQIDKAHEVIEQGGIFRTRRRNMWTAVSSDGTTTYLTALQACTCPAGRRGKYRCYHRAAVAILTAAAPRRRRAA